MLLMVCGCQRVAERGAYPRFYDITPRYPTFAVTHG
jgi:hypothetical protein